MNNQLVTKTQLRERLKEILPDDQIPSEYTILQWARLRRIPSYKGLRSTLFDADAVIETIRKDWTVNAR